MIFELLGPLQVVVDGRRVVPDQLMPGRLLAVLLCRANAPVSVDFLVDGMWTETPPVSARKTIQLYVHRLRKLLGETERIQHGPGGYTLVVRPGERDVDRVEELVANAGSDPHDRAARLSQALACWRGQPLAEFADLPAVRLVCDKLDEFRLTVLEQRIEADLELGRHADLVAELAELSVEHPLRERFAAQSMLALYRCGRQAEALTVFRRTRDLLIDELGVEPGPELNDRHTAILRADPALNPPARWATVRPAQLLAAPRPFAGRAAEIEQLDEARPATVAISGMAGVGKTALALHWAHRLRPRFPDGQLYLNLRGFATVEPLPVEAALATLLGALGVAPERIPAEPVEAASLYRSVLAERRVLILLDNAAGVDQIRPLLPGTATCITIVTSRNRLSGLVAIDGAHRLLLDPMPPHDASALLDALLPQRRVAAEPAELTELATACDHLPLALRIAAANLVDQPGRSVADYLIELRRSRLDALAVPDDDQAATRAAFAVSYRRLPPASARLFRLLGLVDGLDTTPAASAALAGDTLEEATALLEALEDAQLLVNSLPGRYTFHDLIRIYARECADREESAPALDRLYDWYLVRLCSADRVLLPYRVLVPGLPTSSVFDTAPEALAWLDGERRNIEALVRHAAATGRHTDTFRFPYLLSGFFESRGWTNAIEMHRLSVAAAVALGAPDIESRARAGLAVALTRARQPEAAVREQEQVLALARRSGDFVDEARALSNLGWMYNELGRPEQALAAYRSALERYGPEAARGYVTVTLHNIGDALSVLGRHTEAVDHHLRALGVARADGDLGQEADSLASLGEARARAGDHKQAVLDYRAALRVLAGTGNQVIEALVHSHLGRSLSILGDAAAVDELAVAAKLHQQLHDVHAAASALVDLARAHLAAGDLDSARHALDEATEQRREAPDLSEQQRLAETAAELASLYD